VVMVDNASKDGSREYLRANHPEVKLIESDSNRGFAGGNNFGLRHCAGQWVYFLNNDTRADDRALEELAAAVAANPGTRVFASFLLNYAHPELADSAGDTVYDNGTPFGFSGYPAKLFTAPRETTAACAGAALYHRDLLESLGGFDEDFFLLFEDLDLSFRARHAGERILFVPGSRILHKGSASIGKLSRLSLFYCERNIWFFFAKNFPAPVLLRMLPDLVFFKAYRLWVALRYRALGGYLRATAQSLALMPRMLGKRRRILSSSRLTAKEFRSLLRKGWFRERLAYRKGDFDVPL
jgi:GT2 family glycosyltransferase